MARRIEVKVREIRFNEITTEQEVALDINGHFLNVAVGKTKWLDI